MGDGGRSGALPRPTELARRWVTSVLRPGDHAVDATAGNGHDSVFLARGVGSGGRLWAFDIQDDAVAATRAALAAAGCDDGRAQVLAESHESMPERVGAGSISAVMFNLGYLPGGDHRVTTRTEATLAGLDGALGLLRPGGIVTVVCYPGHPGGEAETGAVLAWAGDLDPSCWRVAVARTCNTARPAPVLVALWRRRGGC